VCVSVCVGSNFLSWVTLDYLYLNVLVREAVYKGLSRSSQTEVYAYLCCSTLFFPSK
jgi:hypothetical protein